jgi:hypothetical protein
VNEVEHFVYPGTHKRTALKCYLTEMWCEYEKLIQLALKRNQQMAHTNTAIHFEVP